MSNVSQYPDTRSVVPDPYYSIFNWLRSVKLLARSRGLAPVIPHEPALPSFADMKLAQAYVGGMTPAEVLLDAGLRRYMQLPPL